jgi:hypothetical protein
VEQDRLQQIEALEEQGWVIDDECRVLQEAYDSNGMPNLGGPTYMKSPAGVIHEVGYGEVKPITDPTDE